MAKKVKEVEVTEQLTKADEFYIANNLNKTDIELAKDVNKPLPLVQEHLHKTQSGGRINKLLIRDKGCTIMTEGASMASDESRKNGELLARERQEEHVYFMNRPKPNGTDVRR